MVGLIPKIFVLHLLGDTENSLIASNKELITQCQSEDIEIVSSNEKEDFKQIIRKYRPEIVVIEEELFKANINNSSVTYRSKSCQPFKLVFINSNLSKEETLEYFRKGADDVISKDSKAEEIFLKFFSILRRKAVLELNLLTSLPAINRTYTVLEHCRNNLSDWAGIHIDILNFQSYGVMYGVSKSDNVIREAAQSLTQSLINSKVAKYFLGHLGRDNFLILCETDALDVIIRAVKRDFKLLLQKLYKDSDYNNGYIISSAPNKVRRKEGLLNLNIGYCSNIDRNFLSGTDIIEQAVKNKKLAEEKNKRVLIMESDEDFALLLEETLVREGNEARVSSGANNLIKEIEEFMPRTLIIEASKLDGAQSFVPLCQKLQRYKDEFGLQILVATNVSGYQNFLANGADVYIPKPYELETLLKEVRRLRYTHV
ncbi:MAG: hypothetical protein LW817_01290 [Candidatus Caenarcaniphilales bacterium]|jgi:DNA-binding response OmpR family regulator|nr:hypothetical protein [Candidatus Caenarcaniphilales bacterium]